MQDSTHVSPSSEIGPTAADTPDAYRALLERFAEISDLGRARALLAWDERTMMPPSGAEGRAEQLTTLSRIRHQRLTDDRLWDLIEGLAEWAVTDAADRIEADVVRMARRQARRARRVPADLRAEADQVVAQLRGDRGQVALG